VRIENHRRSTAGTSILRVLESVDDQSRCNVDINELFNLVPIEVYCRVTSNLTALPQHASGYKTQENQCNFGRLKDQKHGQAAMPDGECVPAAYSRVLRWHLLSWYRRSQQRNFHVALMIHVRLSCSGRHDVESDRSVGSKVEAMVRITTVFLWPVKNSGSYTAA